MATRKLFYTGLLVVVSLCHQTSAFADPFNTFWQKCRGSNDKAALAACDRAHELRPWDPAVQKRGDDLYLILEKQKTTTSKPAQTKPAPQPQTPNRQPAKVVKDQFDNFWKKCKGANTQVALNACNSALKLRRNNQAVRKRISELTQFLKRQSQPVKKSPDPFDVHWRKCIAKNNKSALKACEEALKLRPRSQKVKNRKNQLAKLLQPTPAPTPTVAQQEPNTPASVQAPEEPVVSKKTIIKNQKILTQLGFDTGGTKGGIGKKTRQAIKKFTQVSGVEISTELDEQDLTKLEAALASHEKAAQKFEVAKQERADGDINAALETVDEAIEMSPWQTALKTFRAELVRDREKQAEDIVLELDEGFKELDSIE
ncbi:MAG: hypothetical protein ACPG51_17795 [Thiolinea sp.]